MIHTDSDSVMSNSATRIGMAGKSMELLHASRNWARQKILRRMSLRVVEGGVTGIVNGSLTSVSDGDRGADGGGCILGDDERSETRENAALLQTQRRRWTGGGRGLRLTVL